MCKERNWSSCVKVSTRTLPPLNDSHEEANARMRLLLRRKSEANIASHNLNLPFVPLKGAITPQGIEQVLSADNLDPFMEHFHVLEQIWLALEARRLEPASCRTLASHYIGAAKHTLNSILRYDLNLPNLLNNIYGSFMLAWLEYSSSTEEADTGTYFLMSFAFFCTPRFPLGCNRILGEALEFGPFVLDCINA